MEIDVEEKSVSGQLRLTEPLISTKLYPNNSADTSKAVPLALAHVHTNVHRVQPGY